MQTYSVAIDGPAGSGKSTVAKKVAKSLHAIYVDTGAMYRAVALYCIREKIPMEEEKVSAVLNKINLHFEQAEAGQLIYLNGEEVTDKVRTQEAGTGASLVASFLPVREYLLLIQQKIASGQTVVMDGRDIATHVLPNAEVKIYLVASVEERAKRRCLELTEKGLSADFHTVKQQILERDENDRNRKHHPLQKAKDAIEIDTTFFNIEEVIEKILNIVQERIKN